MFNPSGIKIITLVISNMKDIANITSILASHKKHISERFKVKEIGVFGSYVRGEQNRKSDIDVLVEFAEPIGFFKFMDLEEYLSGILGAKVDLVSKKALKPYIGARILKEAVYI